MRRAGSYRGPCPGLDVEIESCSKPQSAERSQPILTHSLLRIADCAKNFSLEITLAEVWISKNFFRGGIRNRVDRVVATREIFIERRSEFNFGMTAISSYIAAKRGHFVHHSGIIQNADCTECNSHRNRAREQIPYLLRTGGCRQIPVEMGTPEQCVADSAAHAPRLESRTFERAGDLENCPGRRKSRRQSIVPEHVANGIHLHSS